MSKEQEKNAISIKQLMADQNRLLAEQNKLAKDRLGTDKDTLTNSQDISNVLKDQTKLLTFQKAEKSAILRSTNSITKLSEKLTSLSKKELGDSKAISNLAKDRAKINKDIILLKNTQRNLTKNTKGLTEDQYKLNVNLADSIEDQINNAIALKVELQTIENVAGKISESSGVKNFQGITEFVKSVPGLSGFSSTFEAAADASKDIAAEMEGTNFGIEKFKLLRDEGVGMQDALEQAGISASDLKINGGKGFSQGAIDIASMDAGAAKLKSSFKKALGPIAILAFIANEMFAALKASDASTGELAKNMNMSYSEASSLRSELQSISNLSGDVLINSKGLQESLIAVNAELGTNVMLNSENLKTYTLLREASGLSMEDQKGIVALTNATKGNAEDITKEILGQAKITATNNKAVLNEKTLLKDISNISAATTLSFGKDAGLIGETVATVKSLGMEMSKVNAIADSLLDFESSIENELSAELLLNKDLNLEKARQYALNNDLAGVAREIAEQAGTSAEFGEMNRIKQESLAKAVGMGREELAKTLFVQEQIGNLSKEEADLREQRINKLQEEGLSNEQIKKKLGEESFKDLQNQASVQERLNKSVEKLREVFISIAGPVMQLVSPIIDLLIPAITSIVWLLEPVFTMFRGISEILTGSFDTLSGWELALGGMAVTVGVFYATMKGIAAVQGVINVLKASENSLSLKGIAIAIREKAIKYSSAIVEVVKGAWSSFGPIPIVGGILAAGAAIAGIAYLASNSKKAGDVNSPADGKTQISTKEGGLFELSKNDDIVAFPGASKMAANAQGGSNTTVVQAPENKKTNELLEAIFKVQNKQPQLSSIGLYEVQ
jgi:hypothetical protein